MTRNDGAMALVAMNKAIALNPSDPFLLAYRCGLFLQVSDVESLYITLSATTPPLFTSNVRLGSSWATSRVRRYTSFTCASAGPHSHPLCELGLLAFTFSTRPSLSSMGSCEGQCQSQSEIRRKSGAASKTFLVEDLLECVRSVLSQPSETRRPLSKLPKKPQFDRN